MERSLPNIAQITKTYCLLTKPGIIAGNVLTMAAGFSLASKGQLNVWLFLASLLGFCLIVASACVFNNYIDRTADAKMARTQNRALVQGLISPASALIFATILGALGTLVLTLFSTPFALIATLFGFLVYVTIYSFSKYRSVHGTLIGSIAGAMPPVVGYCAASGRFDLGALILCAIMVFWQMPHFFAIAIYRIDDYLQAHIPVLPVKKGIASTKTQMLLYTLAFIAASCTLSLTGYVTHTYIAITALPSLAWLALSIQGFFCTDDSRWARRMFFMSLIVVTVLSITIPFTTN